MWGEAIGWVCVVGGVIGSGMGVGCGLVGVGCGLVGIGCEMIRTSCSLIDGVCCTAGITMITIMVVIVMTSFMIPTLVIAMISNHLTTILIISSMLTIMDLIILAIIRMNSTTLVTLHLFNSNHSAGCIPTISIISIIRMSMVIEFLIPIAITDIAFISSNCSAFITITRTSIMITRITITITRITIMITRITITIT